MLLQGKEIGLAPIRCKNRDGSEALKTLHFRINDILFQLRYEYIFQTKAMTTLSRLISLGKELKELNVPDKAKPKKNEILTQLRNICRQLQGYSNYTQTGDDTEEMQKAVNNLVHQYLKEKDGLTLEEALEYTVKTKELYTTLHPFEGKVKLSTLSGIHTELVRKILGEIAI